jgi:hypothetical protein
MSQFFTIFQERISHGFRAMQQPAFPDEPPEEQLSDALDDLVHDDAPRTIPPYGAPAPAVPDDPSEYEWEIDEYEREAYRPGQGDLRDP